MQIAQADFSSDCTKMTQEYLMYFKEFSCNMTKNKQVRCVPRFIQRFLNVVHRLCAQIFGKGFLGNTLRGLFSQNRFNSLHSQRVQLPLNIFFIFSVPPVYSIAEFAYANFDKHCITFFRFCTVFFTTFLCIISTQFNYCYGKIC